MDMDDLLSLSPTVAPSSILKPSCVENFIVLQTPVHKNLKVSFQTPAKTPCENVKPSTIFNTTKSQPTSDENWNIFRNLDEDLRWKERIEVVTKYDHEEYIKFAKEFLEEVVTSVVNHKCNTSKLITNNENVFKDEKRCKNCGSPKKSDLVDQKHPESNPNILNATKVIPDLDADVELFHGKTASKHKETPEIEGKENVKPLADAPRVKKPTSHSYRTDLFRGTQVSSSDSQLSDETFDCESLDFNDFVDDNFNPFASRRTLPNSPICALPLAKKNSPAKKKPSIQTINLTHDGESIVEDMFVTDDDILKDLASLSSNSESSFVKESKDPIVSQTQQTFSQSSFGLSDGEDAFKDASSLVNQGFDFNLDFLETKGNTTTTSDLRKQSLYVKFDPLVGGDDCKSRSLIGRKSDIIDLCGHVGLPHTRSSVAGAKREIKETVKPDFLCDSPSKFMQDLQSVPAENESAPLSEDVVPSSRDEIVQVLKYSETDLEKLLKPIKEENAILKDKIMNQTKESDQMKIVLQEFEQTIQDMAVKCDTERKNNKIVKEDQRKENEKMQSHLESVEKAYLELLQRCEQMKAVIGNYKTNEESYKKAFNEYKTAQEASHQRYKTLKITKEENEQKFLQEGKKREHDFRAQITALTARCKLLDNHAKSVQSQLEQKTTENSELTKICDELIEQQQGGRK